MVLFMHAWMYLPSWSCVCMISSIASLLLVSLLFIAIPTPFLNFKFLVISSLFTCYCTIEPHLSALRLKI